MRFILLLFTVIAIFFFATFLNLKIIFSNNETAKKIINVSNLYPVATAGIRDNIIKYAELPVDQSQLIEVVNNAINETDLKIFVEDFTDQFYALVNGEDKDGKITLHFASLKAKVMNQLGNSTELTQVVNENNYLADREVDLTTNSFLKVLIHLNTYLVSFAIATLFFIVLLLLSGSWAQKLIWLGATFLVSGIAFIGELLFYYFGLSQKVLETLAKESGLKDERFLLGIQKLITSVASFQRVFYLIATATLIILGVVFIVIGNLLKPSVSTAPQIEPTAPLKETPPPAPAQPAPSKDAASLPGKASAGAGTPASEGMRGKEKK